MAKDKLHQIKLTIGDNATQPPFPGGWVLAIFDALNSYAPSLADKHRLPDRKRTHERIKAAKPVKLAAYEEIETKLVKLVSALFPKVSAVNGFAKKYVNEYFQLWKGAAEVGPEWAKCLGFNPGENAIIGRALLRDLVLRLCYLESCERKLNQERFPEVELEFLGYASPAQLYQALIFQEAERRKMSLEKLASCLQVTEKSLTRMKRSEGFPSFKLLLDLKASGVGHRLIAGIGFVDQLLKKLGLHQSELRHEFLAVASVFFRVYPQALDKFKGCIIHKTDSGAIRWEVCEFEEYIAFGEHLLLHPGFDVLWAEIPDSLWRCHLHTLQFARNADLAQAYFQFAAEQSDAGLESALCTAERESDNCPCQWMAKLRQKNGCLPLPLANNPSI